MSDHGRRKHAVLAPSSAERWIACPASVQLIESLDRVDDGGSVWAAEGTRAHELAEIEASYYFGITDKATYTTYKAAWLRKAEDHGDDVEEMERHARAYTSILADLQASMGSGTSIHLEQRLQTGVPGCWGTGDAVLVNQAAVRAVDYKYGRGVAVVAEGNPQLRLYGLGALQMFDLLGTLETVHTTIVQPRVENVSHEDMTANELRQWRDRVVTPAARETQQADARFGPSDVACRWCPAAGACAPRARYITARDFGNPDALSADELAEAVRALPEIRRWCEDIEAEALQQAYTEGKELPGLKVVLSGGKRTITDTSAAVEALVAAGYPAEKVSRTTMQTLSALEKLVGKEALPEVLGDLLVKSEGRPSLVPEDDRRPAINAQVQAQHDFQDSPGI